jgi:hypothetical protein
MVAVYDLECASGDEGLNTAVGLDTPGGSTKTVLLLGLPDDIDTVPGIALPALSFSVNVVGLTVDSCTGSLNVAVMVDNKGTVV